MVAVRFIQDFATKVTNEIAMYDGMLASHLIKIGVAVLHEEGEISKKSKFNPK